MTSRDWSAVAAADRFFLRDLPWLSLPSTSWSLASRPRRSPSSSPSVFSLRAEISAHGQTKLALASEKTAHEATKIRSKVKDQENGRIIRNMQKRQKEVQDAFKQIAEAPDGCARSEAGAIALERLRAILSRRAKNRDP